MKEKESFMREAIKFSIDSRLAGNGGPFGAIVVKDGKIIARGFNKVTSTNDPTAHAEMCVIREAGVSNKNWNLEGLTLYITLEPCLMCAGAVLQSRISRLVFGAFNPGDSSKSTITLLRVSNPQLEVVGGVMDKECSQFLSQWFSKQRLNKG